MRFNRVNLERYGNFTGQSIEFGEPVAEGDFHIVFGPNEAGKSTLRDACIDYLFGFEHITPYNFKHPNSTLLISAEITASDQSISGQRIKRDKDDFRNAAGEVVSDAALKAVMGDVTRATFEQMFSLDEDTLVEGGDEILKSQGDLGALLFSAASGLSFVSASLDNINLEADSFFKQTGRKYRLIEYKKQLDALKGRLKEIDLQAGAYERLHKQAESTETQHKDAKIAREEGAARVLELDSLLQAGEVCSEYNEVLVNLDLFADAPDIPEGLSEEANQLSRDIAVSSGLLKESERAWIQQQRVCDDIELDQIALENAAAISRLNEGDLEARYKTASDIEHRQRDIDGYETGVGNLLQKLDQSDCADIHSLLLPVAVQGGVRDLIERRAGILADKKTTTSELDKAKEIQRNKAKLLKNIKIPFDLGRLDDFLKTNRNLAYDEIAFSQEQQFQTEQARLDEALIALQPWQGTPEDLLEMLVPDPSSLAHLISQADALHKENAELETEASHLKREINDASAEIEGLHSAAGLIDDQMAQATRSERIRAWAKHLEAIDGDDPGEIIDHLKKTAAQFEVAQKEDDNATTQRIMQSGELASLRQAQISLAKSKALSQSTSERQEIWVQKFTGHSADVSSLMVGLGLAQTTRLSFLPAWLEKRDSALGSKRAHALVKNEINVRSKAQAKAQSKIEKLMLAAEIPFDDEPAEFGDQFVLCERVVDVWKENVRRQKIAAEAMFNADNELDRRKQQAEQVRDLLGSWQAKWDEILADTWIRKIRPADVSATIDLIDQLEGLLSKLDDSRQRVEAMKLNRKTYEVEVVRLATVLENEFALDSNEPEPLQLADRLRTRITRAEDDERKLKDRIDALDTLQKHHEEIQNNHKAFDARWNALCQTLGESLNIMNNNELLAQIRRGEEKARVQKQAEQLAKNLRKILGVSDLRTALGKLQSDCSTDDQIKQLRQEQSLLLQDRKVEDEHLAELYHQWKDAERQLGVVGEDGEVARLEEERAVLLLQIEQEAHAYMRLMAGTLMVGEALRTYRDAHRSSMMMRASDAFVQITRGAFSGLTSAPGKNGDILVGTRSDGSSIEAHQMSRGTRFQLYLALRISGHSEFARQHETLPFFADDILEPFDDDRSAETFKLLLEMSKQGQVIYLTHHNHLCDIARQVCGRGVSIHTLPHSLLGKPL